VKVGDVKKDFLKSVSAVRNQS